MFFYQRFVLGRGGPTGVAGVEGDDTAALPGGQVQRLLEDWHRAQAGRKDAQMAIAGLISSVVVRGSSDPRFFE